MYDFPLQIIVVICGGIMIYLLARALPRVPDDTGDSTIAGVGARFENWTRRLPLKQIDEAIIGFFEKVLRKIRVVNMKIENVVNAGIGKLRRGQQAAESEKPKDDLFQK